MNYTTTFCNFAHRLKDGKPIGHQCYILPPAALRAEMAGNTRLACNLIDAAKTHWSYGERSLPNHPGIR